MHDLQGGRYPVVAWIDPDAGLMASIAYGAYSHTVTQIDVFASTV